MPSWVLPTIGVIAVGIITNIVTPELHLWDKTNSAIRKYWKSLDERLKEQAASVAGTPELETELMVRSSLKIVGRFVAALFCAAIAGGLYVVYSHNLHFDPDEGKDVPDRWYIGAISVVSVAFILITMFYLWGCLKQLIKLPLLLARIDKAKERLEPRLSVTKLELSEAVSTAVRDVVNWTLKEIEEKAQKPPDIAVESADLGKQAGRAVAELLQDREADPTETNGMKPSDGKGGTVTERARRANRAAEEGRKAANPTNVTPNYMTGSRITAAAREQERRAASKARDDRSPAQTRSTVTAHVMCKRCGTPSSFYYVSADGQKRCPNCNSADIKISPPPG